MIQYDPTFDRKIYVGHYDLYFMVQCLYLILMTDVWTAYFVIISQGDVVFDHKNIFSASNFFMHIFNMSVTYLQSVEQIQWKLQEELISQSMHYQPIFTACSYRKMAKLKTLSVCQKMFFSIKLLHASEYVCNRCAKCWKDPMKALRGIDFIKCVLSVIIQPSYCKNYRGITLATRPSSPHVHCLMVKVWCKSDRTWTKLLKL